MSNTDDDNLLRRYLLGELPEPEAARIEEEYFASDEHFEQVCVVEDDLVDDYTLGELSESERARFEQRFLLSQSQRDGARFARILLRASSGEPELVTSVTPDKAGTAWWAPFASLRSLKPWVIAAASAVLVLAVLIGLLLIGNRWETVTQEGRARDTASVPAERTAESPDAKPPVARELDRGAVRGKSGARIVTFLLVEGLVRDPGESNRFLIPPDAAVVRLQVTCEMHDYQSYSETLRTAEGSLVARPTVTTQERLSTGRVTVTSQLPAGILKGGDYILTLSGTRRRGRPEVVAEYALRVLQK